MIRDSGISKQDQASNPQAILDAIEFMADAQNVNQDDYAFSKFTRFDHVYANQLLDPAQTQESKKASNSPATSPKSSPSLPKRPTSPAKPPRKDIHDKLNTVSGNLNDGVNIPENNLIRTDSSSFSKIPQMSKPAIAPKPNVSGVFNTISPNVPEGVSAATPLLASRPSLAPKPRNEILQKKTSFSDKSSPIASVSNNINNILEPEKTYNLPASSNRPPVPARPAHTLGIASTDVKSSKFKIFVYFFSNQTLHLALNILKRLANQNKHN